MNRDRIGEYPPLAETMKLPTSAEEWGALHRTLHFTDGCFDEREQGTPLRVLGIER